MNTFSKIVVVFCALSISTIQAAEVEDLRCAAMAGDCDKVESLLRDAEGFFARYGCSLLHLAAESNRTKLLPVLFSHCIADLNRKGLRRDAVTPLYLACQNGHFEEHFGLSVEFIKTENPFLG